MIKKLSLPTFVLALALCLSGASPHARAAFVIDSLSGDITQNELNNFVSTIAGMTPPENNWGNAMAIHGTAPSGMRKMYESTRDINILNHYIRFCDKMLSRRNDLPGGERRTMWEGTIAPVWPNKRPDETFPGYAGCESGMVAGYIASCALLIYENRAIWNNTIPDGNPNGYGATYKARADKYLTEVDYVCNNYISKWFINASTRRVQKPSDPRWASNAGNQSCTAWNRQWLFVMPYLYSAQCHDLRGTAPSHLATFKDVVRQFAAWFVAPYPSGGGVYSTSGGRNVVKWYYEVPTDQHIENIGHAQHDVHGLFECFQSAYSNVTAAQMQVYADTTQYIINKGATNAWAGNVDGTGTATTSLKTDFLWFAQWNRPLYQMIAQSNIDANQLNNKEGCKNVGYILYMKRWLHRHSFSGNYSIVARHSGLSVNVSGSSIADGSQIIQWPYGGGSNQKWQLVSLGGGDFWLRAVHSSKALVIQSASTANGGLAVQWGYSGGNNRNDEWRLDYLPDGYYRLVNRHSGKVLEVPGGSTINGTQLGQWTWAAVNHQQFQFISVP